MSASFGLPEEAVDWKVIEQLRSRKRDGRSGFDRLLPIFVDDARQIVDGLRAAAAAGDAEAVRLAAHKIKGSASVLGSREIKHLSQVMLERAGEGELPAPTQIDNLQLAVQRFTAFAREIGNGV